MQCSVCSGPMRPLFSSFFCPNDCDRQPSTSPGVDSVLFNYGGREWRVARIKHGVKTPNWAVYGWRIVSENPFSLQEIAIMLENGKLGPGGQHVKGAVPGWTVDPSSTAASEGSDLLVYGRVA